MTVHEATESSIVVRVPSVYREQESAKVKFMEQETRGSIRVGSFIYPQTTADITEQARRKLTNFPSSELAVEAERILMVFRNTLAHRNNINLPRVEAFQPEDGSVLIEWIFPHIRLGFSVEPLIEESGWYLVSDENHGGLSLSGYLNRMDNERLIGGLVDFVSRNVQSGY